MEHAILQAGLLAIGFVIFAESGLLVGFFLPGDTLLVSAGILAAQGALPLYWLIFIVVVAAIIGDNVGYQIGRRAGPRLFSKKDGVMFRQEHVIKAEAFYKKHGGKTIILARFIPMVRTFAPVVAGVGKMSRKRFAAFNVVGGVLWGAGLPLVGYLFASKIPGIQNYITPTLILVVVVSFGSAIYHLLKDPKVRAAIWRKIRKS